MNENDQRECMIDTCLKCNQDPQLENEYDYDDNELEDEDYSDEVDNVLNDLLRGVTHSFTLTYSEIKNENALKKEPLSKYTPD